MHKILNAAVICLLLSSCATVTISSKDKYRLSTTPDWESSKPFYLAGLIGEQNIDVTRPCKGTTPAQIQTQTTFLDGLLNAVTFTIYSPKTVKVWCEKGQ